MVLNCLHLIDSYLQLTTEWSAQHMISVMNLLDIYLLSSVDSRILVHECFSLNIVQSSIPCFSTIWVNYTSKSCLEHIKNVLCNYYFWPLLSLFIDVGNIWDKSFEVLRGSSEVQICSNRKMKKWHKMRIKNLTK